MTYIQKLIGRADVSISENDLAGGDREYVARPLPEQHAEQVDLLLGRLTNERTQVDEQIDQLRERRRQLDVSIAAFSQASVALNRESETYNRVSGEFRGHIAGLASDAEIDEVGQDYERRKL